jgi:hypothetical protein
MNNNRFLQAVPTEGKSFKMFSPHCLLVESYKCTFWCWCLEVQGGSLCCIYMDLSSSSGAHNSTGFQPQSSLVSSRHAHCHKDKNCCRKSHKILPESRHCDTKAYGSVELKHKSSYVVISALNDETYGTNILNINTKSWRQTEELKRDFQLSWSLNTTGSLSRLGGNFP